MGSDAVHGWCDLPVCISGPQVSAYWPGLQWPPVCLPRTSSIAELSTSALPAGMLWTRLLDGYHTRSGRHVETSQKRPILRRKCAERQRALLWQAAAGSEVPEP